VRSCSHGKPIEKASPTTLSCFRFTWRFLSSREDMYGLQVFLDTRFAQGTLRVEAGVIHMRREICKTFSVRRLREVEVELSKYQEGQLEIRISRKAGTSTIDTGCAQSLLRHEMGGALAIVRYLGCFQRNLQTHFKFENPSLRRSKISRKRSQSTVTCLGA
jgi:hypothetical protein